MRADLLAAAAPEVEDCLSGRPPLRLPIARTPFGRVAPRSGSQAPGSLYATASLHRTNFTTSSEHVGSRRCNTLISFYLDRWVTSAVFDG
jgi:hypothetical protein